MFKSVTNLRLMREPGIRLAALVSLLCAPAFAYGADLEKDSGIRWQVGPETARLKNIAEIKLPAGYRFADGETTRRLLRSAGQPTSGTEVGMLMPEQGGWTMFFDFSEDGYVKDDDKDKLDADKLLKAIIRGNERGNEERKKMGSPPLIITGWEHKPNYDEETHNLQWAIRAHSGQIINFSTRLLGRKGVMEVVLVCKPEVLNDVLPTFKGLLADYSYKQGERYAEYRQGDKLAKYGLTALITGGAVAIAAKTGLLASLLLLLKKLWKLVVLAFVAVVAFFKRLITGRSEPRTLH